MLFEKGVCGAFLANSMCDINRTDMVVDTMSVLLWLLIKFSQLQISEAV